jgi:hypothetical protein
VERHPLASILMAGASGSAPRTTRTHGTSVDAVIAGAVALTAAGQRAEAVSVVDAALAAAPQGNGGWILPVEPMLQTGGPDWAPVLARLRSRAA